MYLYRISAGMAPFLKAKEPCDNCFRCRCQGICHLTNSLSVPTANTSNCPKRFPLRPAPILPHPKSSRLLRTSPRPILNIGFPCLAYVQQVYRIKCVPSYIIAITAAKCLTLLTAGLRCVYCTYILHNSHFGYEMLNPNRSLLYVYLCTQLCLIVLELSNGYPYSGLGFRRM